MGRGTRGARCSWRVEIFFIRLLLRRVRGAIVVSTVLVGTGMLSRSDEVE